MKCVHCGNKTSEATKIAMQAKRTRREYTGGYEPYGYQRVAGKVVEVEAEQDVIRRVRSLHLRGLTLRAIAATLIDVPTKRGGKWHANSVARLLERSA